jgi:tetratricopeptide (TPR) repeat protein
VRILRLQLVLVCLPFFSNCLAQSKNEPDSVFIINLDRPQSKESLLKVLEEAPDGTAKINALIRLSLSLYFTQTEKRGYVLQALALSRKENHELEIALCYMSLAGVGKTTSEVDSCLHLVEAHGNRNLLYQAQLNASYSFMSLGSKYVDAFRMMNQFVNSYPYRTDSISFSRAWNILGEVYRSVHNYPKALTCYKTALSYSFLEGRLTNAAPYINMGTIHRNMGHYDSALMYYDKAKKLAVWKNLSMDPYVNFRKAQIMALQKEFPSALQLALKSMRRYDSLNYRQGGILASSTVAQIYHLLGNDAESLRYGAQTIKTGLAINYYPDELQEICLTLADIYEHNHRFEEASHYQKLYSQLRDSIFGPSVNLRLFNEQLSLETHNQDLRNQLASEKERIAHLELVAQQRLVLRIIVVLVFFVVVSILLYRRNKTIRRLNAELRNKQDEVLAQAEELKSTNEEIESINTNLEKLVEERSRKVIEQNEKLQEYSYFNAHKIRGPLARVLGLVNIMEFELTQRSMIEYNRMLKQAGLDLDQSIREINQILEDDPRSG